MQNPHNLQVGDHVWWAGLKCEVLATDIGASRTPIVKLKLPNNEGERWVNANKIKHLTAKEPPQ